MAMSTRHWSAALLTGFVALAGCADQGTTGPPAAAEESVVLASARKPFHQDINETYSFELNCGSFTGVSSGGFSGHETIFFDAAGIPLRLQGHLRYRATITNTATGKTLTDNAAYNFKIDLVTGVVEVNGFIYNVKDRETGFRIKDIGRIVFDAAGNIAFEAGRHDAGGFGDATPLYCTALA